MIVPFALNILPLVMLLSGREVYKNVAIINIFSNLAVMFPLGPQYAENEIFSLLTYTATSIASLVEAILVLTGNNGKIINFWKYWIVMRSYEKRLHYYHDLNNH